jgi:hypothetical protein
MAFSWNFAPKTQPHIGSFNINSIDIFKIKLIIQETCEFQKKLTHVSWIINLILKISIENFKKFTLKCEIYFVTEKFLNKL